MRKSNDFLYWVKYTLYIFDKCLTIKLKKNDRFLSILTGEKLEK